MLEKEPLDFRSSLMKSNVTKSLFRSIINSCLPFFSFFDYTGKEKGGPNSRPKKERRLYRGDSILHLRSHSSPEPYFFFSSSVLFLFFFFLFLSGQHLFLFLCFLLTFSGLLCIKRDSMAIRVRSCAPVYFLFSFSLSLFFQDMLHLWFSFSSSLAPSSSSPAPGI